MKHFSDKNKSVKIEKADIPLIKIQVKKKNNLSRPIDVNNFENYVKKSLADGTLEEQHKMFGRDLLYPVVCGSKNENKNKNRYINLIAYDSTRVKLKPLPGDPHSDYINANYIDGYDKPKKYIATQGPKQSTVHDFWRMVLQENVSVICMLTKTKEGEKDKCFQYWPSEEGSTVNYGKITVINKSRCILADYVCSTLQVVDENNQILVNHLHYTTWSDHDVTQYAESLVPFLNKFRSFSSDDGPKLVHCSAGVGRTGTIILADICIEMAQKTGKIDVLQFQDRIRKQRANLVDSGNQYKLVHMLIIETLFGKSTSIPCTRLKSEVKKLKYFEELKNLETVSWKDNFVKGVEDKPSQEDIARKENRNSIVPGPRGRVYIPRYPHSNEKSDYINACPVDGFRVKDQFIATQFPLEHTIHDFWRMIYSREIRVVVVLNEIDTGDKTVTNFIPSMLEKTITCTEHICITYEKEEDYQQFSIIETKVRNSKKPEADLIVTVVQNKHWKSEEVLPPPTEIGCPEDLRFLWETIQKYMYRNDDKPVVITCYDGATACGLFAALSFVIEKMKLEQECDVPLAIRTIRRRRKEFVTDVRQYKYLFNAAINYLDTFEIYNNFDD